MISARANTMQVNHIFNYKLGIFEEISHKKSATCEDICVELCKSNGILPTTRLLFGLRPAGSDFWLTPSRLLKPEVKYNFRMRFKVPDVDVTLQKIDPNAYEYLYSQIRCDLVTDKIQDIRYPAKKDNVVGLGVVDMYIDLLERKDCVENLEKNYKHYLPKQLVKTHKFFAKKKICEGFHHIRQKNHDLPYVKRTYMHTITNLSPNYLMEMYSAIVDHIPGDDVSDENEDANYYTTHRMEHVYVKLDLHDSTEPGLKISKITSEDKLKVIEKF